MARLSRFTQLVFGSNAGTNQMAQYGSLAASSPERFSGTTITPSIVQALGNYLDGWFSAVIAQNSPAIEDMNALCYLFAYQLSYLMQAGVPEWDSGTTYFTGDLVQSSGILFVSIANTNLNNPVTDDVHWAQPTQNGTVTPNSLPSNTVVVTGTTLTWANLTIASGNTLTVNSGGDLLGIRPMTVNGTLTINGTASYI